MTPNEELIKLVDVLITYITTWQVPIQLETNMDSRMGNINEEFENIGELQKFVNDPKKIGTVHEYSVEYLLEEHIRIGFGDNTEVKPDYQCWIGGDITKYDSTYSGDVLDFSLSLVGDKGVNLEDVSKRMIDLWAVYVNLRNFIRSTKESMWKYFKLDTGKSGAWKDFIIETE